MTDSS